MIIEHISAEVILFFILYGITGVVPLIAVVYLLRRRGNAFAPDITPPVRLRRWAASFFASSVLGHVWWFLFYIYSGDIHSVSYLVVAILDCVGMLITIAGTLLAMLQDRKRPIWPAFVAMIPFSALVTLQISYPDSSFTYIATAYVLLLYVLFSIYMVFAVRQYGRWLNDNYADLENKKVWLSQVVSFVFLLLFILYQIVDTYNILIYPLHIIELAFFGLLLWRVETLPQLDSISIEEAHATPVPETAAQVIGSPLATERLRVGAIAGMGTQEPDVLTQTQQAPAIPTNIDFSQIEQLLAKRCVGTQLYLQHDLTLQQLAQAIGTNRSYLSQYFSNQGTTYNAYINDLRINHFMHLYREATTGRQPIVAQQLASQSGYRSYSTFGRAFMQRMGQSVTAWMHHTTEASKQTIRG